MVDVMTREQRSRCMAGIRGANTQPERLLRQGLFSAGLRYRLQGRLPGRPDIVFPREKVCVFVDGCFWHGCPLHATKPAHNASFWAKKLERNAERDREVDAALIRDGWRVLRFWEHEVRRSTLRAVTKVERAVELRRASLRQSTGRGRQTPPPRAGQ